MASTPSPLGRLRLSEFGWGRRAALIVAALICSAALAYAGRHTSRHALWRVVQVCELDKATTGSPLPCLAVDDGYAVLRPPFGKPDTILTPTRRIVGIEDPLLLRSDTPNYFALAWEERRWLNPPPPPERAALAVNSRQARWQDQLHIHIGCLVPQFAGRLGNRALGPKTGAWFRAPDMAPGLELWTYRTGAKDWAGLDPFRLLQPLVGDAAGMARTTLAAALVGGELVLAALRSRPGGWYASAEDVIETRC